MNIQSILDELFAMTFHSGIKPGLDRIADLCLYLNQPQLRYPVVHVAGTNGKGSTSAMIASILTKAGYKTGLYTSPHIRRFNERISINGVMISDEDVARMARPLMDRTRSMEGTFFEVTTAMAFQYFAEKRVDAAVIETGLGGRLDATNICQPLISIITQIGLDHTEYLGNTLPQIAGEKAGIIKHGAPAIIGAIDPSLRSVFQRRADDVGTSITFVTDTVHVEVDAIHPDLTMTVSAVTEEARSYYTTDLCGAHQASNLATVLAALPSLREVYFIDEDHIRDGLRNVKATTGIYGRCELISASPFLMLDVSHNHDGLLALRTTLVDAGYAGACFQVVLGVMADKDVTAMLEAIAPIAQSLHLCAPKVSRAMPVEQLMNLALLRGITNVVAHSSVAHAFRAARSLGSTVVCGSFHVADEAVSEYKCQSK